MALKEEKVPVTSGKKKASGLKETNAVSGMRVTIVHKNQTTMPPHLLSHPFHEVEECRGKELSEAKVTIARGRLVNIGIRPSANSIKMKRVVRQETSVCSAIQG